MLLLLLRMCTDRLEPALSTLSQSRRLSDPTEIRKTFEASTEPLLFGCHLKQLALRVVCWVRRSLTHRSHGEAGSGFLEML